MYGIDPEDIAAFFFDRAITMFGNWAEHEIRRAAEGSTSDSQANARRQAALNRILGRRADGSLLAEGESPGVAMSL